MRRVAIVILAALAACRPPAADDYVERLPLDHARAQGREPLASPDSQGAIWASSGGPDRIVYGKPGNTPLLAIACAGNGTLRRIEITRFAATDPKAKALMALIGNGHMARLNVDAAWNGKAWLYQGAYDPKNPELDVLTGPREVELTIPGMGTVKLNPSPRPGELVERCRRLAAPTETTAVPPPGPPETPAPE
jgi:hypothetical protein